MPDIFSFKDWLEGLSKLSDDQKQELFKRLQSDMETESDRKSKEQETSKIFSCPHCGCVDNIVKHGIKDGKQRFRCKDCGKTFSLTTETFFYRSRIEEWQWKEIIRGKSDKKLEFTEDFVPSDKQSIHYRTEFRLNAYSDAIGKSYQYDGVMVDIVAKKELLSDSNIRIYMDGATLDQCEQMIKYASPIMDKTASDGDIQGAINQIKEHKEANGYYYANLGLLLLGNDTKGYEFMLKMGND